MRDEKYEHEKQKRLNREERNNYRYDDVDYNELKRTEAKRVIFENEFSCPSLEIGLISEKEERWIPIPTHIESKYRGRRTLSKENLQHIPFDDMLKFPETSLLHHIIYSCGTCSFIYDNGNKTKSKNIPSETEEKNLKPRNICALPFEENRDPNSRAETMAECPLFCCDDENDSLLDIKLVSTTLGLTLPNMVNTIEESECKNIIYDKFSKDSKENEETNKVTMKLGENLFLNLIADVGGDQDGRSCFSISDSENLFPGIKIIVRCDGEIIKEISCPKLCGQQDLCDTLGNSKKRSGYSQIFCSYTPTIAMQTFQECCNPDCDEEEDDMSNASENYSCCGPDCITEPPIVHEKSAPPARDCSGIKDAYTLCPRLAGIKEDETRTSNKCSIDKSENIPKPCTCNEQKTATPKRQSVAEEKTANTKRQSAAGACPCNEQTAASPKRQSAAEATPKRQSVAEDACLCPKDERKTSKSEERRPSKSTPKKRKNCPTIPSLGSFSLFFIVNEMEKANKCPCVQQDDSADSLLDTAIVCLHIDKKNPNGQQERKSIAEGRKSVAEERKSIAEGRKSISEQRKSISEGRKSIAKDPCSCPPVQEEPPTPMPVVCSCPSVANSSARNSIVPETPEVATPVSCSCPSVKERQSMDSRNAVPEPPEEPPATCTCGSDKPRASIVSKNAAPPETPAVPETPEEPPATCTCGSDKPRPSIDSKNAAPPETPAVPETPEVPPPATCTCGAGKQRKSIDSKNAAPIETPAVPETPEVPPPITCKCVSAKQRKSVDSKNAAPMETPAVPETPEVPSPGTCSCASAKQRKSIDSKNAALTETSAVPETPEVPSPVTCSCASAKQRQSIDSKNSAPTATPEVASPTCSCGSGKRRQSMDSKNADRASLSKPPGGVDCSTSPRRVSLSIGRPSNAGEPQTKPTAVQACPSQKSAFVQPSDMNPPSRQQIAVQAMTSRKSAVAQPSYVVTPTCPQTPCPRPSTAPPGNNLQNGKFSLLCPPSCAINLPKCTPRKSSLPTCTPRQPNIQKTVGTQKCTRNAKVGPSAEPSEVETNVKAASCSCSAITSPESSKVSADMKSTSCSCSKLRVSISEPPEMEVEEVEPEVEPEVKESPCESVDSCVELTQKPPSCSFCSKPEKPSPKSKLSRELCSHSEEYKREQKKAECIKRLVEENEIFDEYGKEDLGLKTDDYEILKYAFDRFMFCKNGQKDRNPKCQYLRKG